VMNQLNHRPRKTLGFRTPYEVFFNTRTPMTVALSSWIQVSLVWWSLCETIGEPSFWRARGLE